MKEPSRRYYVYAHTRKDTGAIFYIGKGCGRRAYSASGRSQHWTRISQKHGFNVSFLSEGVSETQAFEFEKLCISSHGDLCNVTEGGEGASGCRHTEEAKEAIRRAHAGKSQCPELVRRRAEKLRGKKRSAEFSVWLSGVHKGRKHSEETKAKMRAAHIGRKQSPDSVEKTASAHRGMKRSESSRQLMSSKQPKCPVICVCTGQVFESVTAAANWLRENGWPKATKTGVWRCASGGGSLAYGYRWEYYVSTEPQSPVILDHAQAV